MCFSVSLSRMAATRGAWKSDVTMKAVEAWTGKSGIPRSRFWTVFVDFDSRVMEVKEGKNSW